MYKRQPVDLVYRKTNSLFEKMFSLEMDSDQLAAKRISRLTGIPSERLLMQPLTDAEAAQTPKARH